jgi:hypothetical protein
MTRVALVLVATLIGCKRDEPAPAPPPPAAARAPIRDVAGDKDVRALIADLASAKACEQIRGRFRGLRAAERPSLVTGVLWIRDCKITNDDTRVTFRISGNGWQWVNQSKKKAGGTFNLRQYVRFVVDVTIPGALDIAYDRTDHVVSLFFTPSTTPQVDFKPVGDFDVDRKSVWASIIGGLSSVVASSPEEMAETDAKHQGTQQFEQTLADGLAVTVNLCTGLSRFNLGRRPKGTMQPPDIGETKRVPIELHPHGIVMAGPQLAPKGMKIYAETTQGAVQIALACRQDAEAVAKAFVAGREQNAASILGSVNVRGKATLKIKPVTCPVIAIARPLDAAPTTFSWMRLPSEIALNMGGPVLDCRSAKAP